MVLVRHINTEGSLLHWFGESKPIVILKKDVYNTYLWKVPKGVVGDKNKKLLEFKQRFNTVLNRKTPRLKK